MPVVHLDRIASFLTSTELFLGLLWAGLAALSITLLLLLRTRWGQSRPLRKCLVLSLLAHLLLVGYATTVQMWSTGPQTRGEPTMRVSLADAEPSPEASEIDQQRPWDEFVHEAPTQPPLAEPAPAETPPSPTPSRVAAPPPDALTENVDLEQADSTLLDQPELDTSAMQSVRPSPPLAGRPESLEAPKARRREAAPVTVPTNRPAEQPEVASTADAPERPAQPGLPSVLRDPKTPLPRVDEQADSPDVGQMVQDVTDRPAPTPQGEPAEATAAPAGSEPQPADSVADGGGSPSTPKRSDSDALAARPPTTQQMDPPRPLPAIYRARLAPDRARAAQRRGATSETEAAVAAALKWLASNQSPDGRWSAALFGAGQETRIAGHDRRGAGARADTGITGLALLAFLAAGHTHEQGEYQRNVGRAVEFLINSQRPDGNLAGEATLFAKMYCHAMATFALSEAYGMTADARLEGPVRRAIDYTVAAQDPRGGGWRYTPESAGDTSQLGWQLMALRSAELAGVPAPPSTRSGALHFLRSVSSGRHGGLASYRPAEGATRPMTAEAMVCRQLLGMPPTSPTATEAADYLLGELPGDGPANLYYWYYSTLALYQAQGEHWSRWNRALQKELLARQRETGLVAGSWDPDTLWAGYGGRVYSTAMATLCLEVYYRYLPQYLQTAGGGQNPR